MNFRRSAPAFLAVLVIAAAGACSGSAATQGPQAPGGSKAPGASSAVVDQNNPDSILNGVISGSPDVKSLHIKIEMGGTIKAAALKDAGGSDSPLGAIATSDLKLDGMSLEGDIDVSGQAAHMTLNVPAMQALGGQPITGDLILKDQNMYYKVSLLGPKYTKSSLGSLTSGLPVAVPSPGASALSGMTDEVAKFRQQMKDAGVVAKLVGVDQIGGKDANHINLSVPLDKLNAQLADSSPDAGSANMKIDAATVDFWIYKETNRLAKIQVTGASAALGNLSLTITVTNYDVPVSIAAPAASDVNATTP